MELPFMETKKENTLIKSIRIFIYTTLSQSNSSFRKFFLSVYSALFPLSGSFTSLFHSLCVFSLLYFYNFQFGYRHLFLIQLFSQNILIHLFFSFTQLRSIQHLHPRPTNPCQNNSFFRYRSINLY